MRRRRRTPGQRIGSRSQVWTRLIYRKGVSLACSAIVPKPLPEFGAGGQEESEKSPRTRRDDPLLCCWWSQADAPQIWASPCSPAGCWPWWACRVAGSAPRCRQIAPAAPPRRLSCQSGRTASVSIHFRARQLSTARSAMTAGSSEASVVKGPNTRTSRLPSRAGATGSDAISGTLRSGRCLWKVTLHRG